eukprot:TRINITY_DN8735_c0_g1_i2.p1 TRINITY_DN8735_c0_g1~~TRINITY_DN8735_c0_g1_i2.p1  ORF type:complete len:174 (-),score=24.14 TRINITY_DN8735_c0_g1_i2:286-807(-)
MKARRSRLQHVFAAVIYLGRMGQLFIDQARRLASECKTKRVSVGCIEIPKYLLDMQNGVPVLIAVSVFIVIVTVSLLNLLAAQLDGAYLAIYNDIGGYFDYKPVYSPALERGHDSEAQQIATFLGAFIYLGRMGQLFINQARRLASECETKRLCPWGASEFPSICLICRTKSQ